MSTFTWVLLIALFLSVAGNIACFIMYRKMKSFINNISFDVVKKIPSYDPSLLYGGSALREASGIEDHDFFTDTEDHTKEVQKEFLDKFNDPEFYMPLLESMEGVGPMNPMFRSSKVCRFCGNVKPCDCEEEQSEIHVEESEDVRFFDRDGDRF